MKTIILQLDDYDDVLSACDKMNWAKGERLLLVWPERRPILDRRLDMLRLQRRSREMGAQLALVTRDADARYHALHLGIPVFTSVKKAQKSPWRVPHRYRRAAALAAPLSERLAGSLAANPPSAQPADAQQASDPIVQSNTSAEPPLSRLDALLLARQDARPQPWRYANHRGWFVLGVLAVLALAAVLLPQAELRLTPAERVQDVVLDVTADESLSAPTLAGGVPAQWQEVIVEGRQSRPASGAMRLPDQVAQGHVIFTNLSDQPLEIPIGTVVRSLGEPPVRFTVSQAGKLAAGPGVTITLPILAAAPGVDGNLPAATITAIEGLLGAQATASNPRSTTGGSQRSVPAPTSADRQALEAGLTAELQDSARRELQAALPEGDLLILPSVQLAETVEQDSTPAPDQPADTLTVHLRLKFRALMVRGSDLRRLAGMIFDANLPPGFSATPESLSWEVVYPQGAQPGMADSNRFSLHAYRQIVAVVDEQRAVQAALGAAPGQAAQRLQSLAALETAPQIVLTPAWWPRLPIVPFRIHITRLNP